MPEPIAAAPSSPPPHTIGQAQRHLTAQFRAAGLDTPALDARLLVTAALGLDAADGFRRPDFPIPPEVAARIEAFAHRRLAREPVSRILGTRQFHGLDLEIGPATLDPRPETETLVDAALELVRAGVVPGGDAPRILDLGTGSGAIIIALLTALPAAQGVATDIDTRALAVAERNARRHKVDSRLDYATTRWLDGLAGPFDLIVSNPPYIPGHAIDGLQPEVALHDPRRALDGGGDGLEAYRQIVEGAGAALTSGGWLAFEIGLNQENEIAQIVMGGGKFVSEMRARQWRDLAGVTRCVAFQARPGTGSKKSLDFLSNRDTV